MSLRNIHNYEFQALWHGVFYISSARFYQQFCGLPFRPIVVYFEINIWVPDRWYQPQLLLHLNRFSLHPQLMEPWNPFFFKHFLSFSEISIPTPVIEGIFRFTRLEKCRFSSLSFDPVSLKPKISTSSVFDDLTLFERLKFMFQIMSVFLIQSRLCISVRYIRIFVQMFRQFYELAWIIKF